MSVYYFCTLFTGAVLLFFNSSFSISFYLLYAFRLSISSFDGNNGNGDNGGGGCGGGGSGITCVFDSSGKCLSFSHEL